MWARQAYDLKVMHARKSTQRQNRPPADKLQVRTLKQISRHPRDNWTIRTTCVTAKSPCGGQQTTLSQRETWKYTTEERGRCWRVEPTGKKELEGEVTRAEKRKYETKGVEHATRWKRAEKGGAKKDDLDRKTQNNRCSRGTHKIKYRTRSRNGLWTRS